MAGITLEQAQTRLDALMNATTTSTGEKSVSINGRTVVYHDPDKLHAEIDYWNRMVIRLSRGSGVSLSRVVVHD